MRMTESTKLATKFATKINKAIRQSRNKAILLKL